MSGHWIVRLATVDALTQERAAAAIRDLAGVRFAQPTYRLAGGAISFIPTNRVSVRFKGTTTQVQVDSLSAALGLELIRPPRPDSGFFDYAFRYPAGPTARPLAIAALLDRNPLVQWADPERISSFRRLFIPGDPFYSFQWHLKNTVVYNGTLVDDNVETAWDITRGSGSIKVAVIDDGIQMDHPDIGFGPAANGALGYDTMNPPSGETDDAFHPYQGDPFKPDIHGTAVAGLIFADHNGQGVSGIAPLTIIRSVRIFRGSTIGSNSQVAQGINWAWSVAASDVLNNSWTGGAPSNEINDAITNARTLGRGGKGSVVVFAAGNEYPDPVSYPSNLPGVVTVGAITKNGPRAGYSQTGPELDLVAPSSGSALRCSGDIVTLDLLGSLGCSDGPGGSFDYSSSFGATSAATAQVSAVAALVLSVYPGWSEYAVRSRLCSSAIPWGPSNEFGCGKLDAYRAVAPPPTVTVSGPSSVRPGWTCVWTAAASGGVPPYSGFAWMINNSSVAGNGDELQYTNSGNNFTATAQVTDAVGGLGSTTKSVTVSASAPACQF